MGRLSTANLPSQLWDYTLLFAQHHPPPESWCWAPWHLACKTLPTTPSIPERWRQDSFRIFVRYIHLRARFSLSQSQSTEKILSLRCLRVLLAGCSHYRHLLQSVLVPPGQGKLPLSLITPQLSLFYALQLPPKTTEPITQSTSIAGASMHWLRMHR